MLYRKNGIVRYGPENTVGRNCRAYTVSPTTIYTYLLYNFMSENKQANNTNKIIAE